MKRKVFGIVYNLKDIPWTNARLRFDLVKGSYTDGIQYPADRTFVTTDSDGYFEVELWINVVGIKESEYRCTLPDNRFFRFNVINGTEAINIAELRRLYDNAIIPNPPTNGGENTAQNLVLQTLTINQGQLSFALPRNPNPLNAQLYLNGNKATLGKDFVIDGNLINWVTTTPRLETSDNLELYY